MSIKGFDFYIQLQKYIIEFTIIQKRFADRRLNVSGSFLILESCSAKASTILKSSLHSLQGRSKLLLIIGNSDVNYCNCI